jgi:hypothetical protein
MTLDQASKCHGSRGAFASLARIARQDPDRHLSGCVGWLAVFGVLFSGVAAVSTPMAYRHNIGDLVRAPAAGGPRPAVIINLINSEMLVQYIARARGRRQVKAAGDEKSEDQYEKDEEMASNFHLSLNYTLQTWRRAQISTGAQAYGSTRWLWVIRWKLGTGTAMAARSGTAAT